MKLLENLVNLHAPSGEEYRVRDFLIDYINSASSSWKVKPKLYYGDEFQDTLIVSFGKPRTAIFAHMDTVGFTCRYDNQLVPIGGPAAKSGYALSGQDTMGPIACKLKVDDEGNLFHDFPRGIDRGTSLVFQSNFRLTDTTIQSPYMDDRLGIYNALKVAETLENGVIAFSAYEEHGGGTVPFMIKFLHEKFGIRQCLVSDITWVTDGVQAGNGVVISQRDVSIPRRLFLNKVIELANQSGIPYQLEVEGSGGSDGKELQASPYPIDWCFIGAPEDNVHSPDEIVNLNDIQAMIDLYVYLMEKL
ncbi:MAG: M20/M25/M40 family metallo-hydrolase [Cyclobacteriaceae bacterium]